MRIAIVGPTHPYKGGIAQHTTALATELQEAGHDVTLLSWRKQYPFFYPGVQFVPDNEPEIPPFDNTKRVLSWKNPLGWLNWGRRLRDYDQVILIWWVPTIQGPVYLNMLKAMGKNRPKVTVICHNVLPHDARKGDRALTKSVLSSCDLVLTHTDKLGEVARKLSATPVKIAKMPFVSQSKPQVNATQDLKHRLLFFGYVRPYKGLDVLLRALAQNPDIKLTIAGEFWGGTTKYMEIIDELGIDNRVTIREGYVKADEINELFESCDALVLPYRSGTASWNVDLAHSHRMPVVATKVGSMASQVRDGIDGILCEPDDTKSLSSAIKRLYEPNMANKLAQNIPTDSSDKDWKNYINVLLKD